MIKTTRLASTTDQQPGGGAPKTARFLELALAILLATALAACGTQPGGGGGDGGGGGGGDQDPPPPPPPARVEYETATVTGSLELPAGASIDTANLMINTLAGSALIGESGEFSVDAPVTAGLQMHIVTFQDTDTAVMIGLSNSEDGSVEISADSTAVALLLLHPYAAVMPREDLGEFVATAKALEKYDQLVIALEDAIATDLQTALNLDFNPGIFQLALEIVEEAAALLAPEPDPEILQADPDMPMIESGASGFITVVNPMYIHYGAGIEPQDEEAETIAVLVDARSRSQTEWEWQWPPAAGATAPATTSLRLADGYYHIDLMSYDPSLVASWDRLVETNDTDALALATLHNTADTLRLLFSQVMHELPVPTVDERTHSGFPAGLEMSDVLHGLLSSTFAARDAVGLTDAFTGIMTANAEALSDWFWIPGDGLGEDYVLVAAKLLNVMTQATRAYDFGDDRFYPAAALYSAPPMTYHATMLDGELVSTTPNTAPVASFTASPPAGFVGRPFTFDASLSMDDTGTDHLQFRWDFNSDGLWDTEWLSENTITYTYDAGGAYVVRLEVRDATGLTGTAALTLNVGGGAGTANHVLLLMDHLPWDSEAMIEVLHSLGFTEGAGAMTYEIVTRDQFSTIPLRPQEDLVIVSNDQKYDFYLEYARNQVRFNNFVLRGGSMFWGASDLGWNNGSMLMAGVELPGRVVQMQQYDTHNFLVDPELPLTLGLPAEMEHNFASHERFSDLVPGTTVYLEDTFGLPTLIEFSLGHGWVIMSGQPLEFQYDRPRDNGLETLLPRIISYFTGVERPFDPETESLGLPTQDSMDGEPASSAPGH